MPERAALMVPSSSTWDTRLLIERSAALRGELATAIARSRALLSLGHERRLSATYPGLRPIAGGSDRSDASLVVEALTRSAPACLECLVRTTGVPAPRVTEALAQLQRVAVIAVRKIARCDGCRRHSPIYQIGEHPSGVEGAREPAEADRAASLTNLLLERPMCLPCLSAKAGLTVLETSGTLQKMSLTVRLTSTQELCPACDETRAVLTVGANNVEAPVRRRPTIRNKLLAFLRAHRGASFCAPCLAGAAQTTRADIPIRELEGLGVRRQQGSCARCGVAGRLVSGLPA